jgi:hypothetical protein
VDSWATNAVSPILAPSSTYYVDLPIKTRWSAQSYRRAIALICYTWRVVQQANHANPESLRAAFVQGQESSESMLRPWLDVATLLYDMWSHVDEQIRALPQSDVLYKNTFLQLRLGRTGRDGAFVPSVQCESNVVSRLLTNIKSYVSEYSGARETDWYQERVATYRSNDASKIVTTRMSKHKIAHTIDSIESSVVAAAGANSAMSVDVCMRATADARLLPPMTRTERVSIIQRKSFVWHDSSYASTVHAGHASRSGDALPEWTLHLELVWDGPTMLAVDAAMASRAPPCVNVIVETGPVSTNVRRMVAAEMTL